MNLIKNNYTELDIGRLIKTITVCFFCTHVPMLIIIIFNSPWFIPPSLLYFFGGMVYCSYLKSEFKK